MDIAKRKKFIIFSVVFLLLVIIGIVVAVVMSGKKSSTPSPPSGSCRDSRGLKCTGSCGPCPSNQCCDPNSGYCVGNATNCNDTTNKCVPCNSKESQTCVNGSCVTTLPCKTSGDCKPGSNCVNGSCVCQKGCASGQTCGYDPCGNPCGTNGGGCPGGQNCSPITNTCCTSTCDNVTCNNTDTCTGNKCSCVDPLQCDPKTNKCVSPSGKPCTAPGGTNPCTGGYICNSSGVCVPPTPVIPCSNCTNDQVCVVNAGVPTCVAKNTMITWVSAEGFTLDKMSNSSASDLICSPNPITYIIIGGEYVYANCTMSVKIDNGINTGAPSLLFNMIPPSSIPVDTTSAMNAWGSITYQGIALGKSINDFVGYNSTSAVAGTSTGVIRVYLQYQGGVNIVVNNYLDFNYWVMYKLAQV